MKQFKLLLIYVFLLCKLVEGQVKTNFNNESFIGEKGQFSKEYKSQIDFELPAQNISELLIKEKNELSKSTETKPFQIAIPVSVDLDIAKIINWTFDNEFAFGKFTVKLNGALSASINFDKFYLPKGTEMYVYNENGNMITGPITENENNVNKIWGSWFYRGQILTIEIKTPKKSNSSLVLHSNNIAYGYKEVYKSLKVGGFGNSGSCNINVICPLGTGWEPERNSVAIVLDAAGQSLCSGSMVMNTCNTNQPFFLTANHCYQTNPIQNVSAWRFTFQAWSTTCPNPGIDATGTTYNGSTLRANWANSDFCLVELNNIPPANSGINYSGWTKSTTPAKSTTGIHHPKGDVMKISRAIAPVSIVSAFGTTNQHWQVNWSQGVTEGGSSGSPLYDPNHRIIGQLQGGLSACGSLQLIDYYGRFDLSWTGGGTNATRLSNWLDPNNSGAITTNTTNVNALFANVANTQTLTITGTPTNDFICSGSSTYSIPSLPANFNGNIVWSISNPSLASINIASNGLSALVTKIGNGVVTLTATVTICGQQQRVINKTIILGSPGGIGIVNYSNMMLCDGNVSFRVLSAIQPSVFNFSGNLNVNSTVPSNSIVWSLPPGFSNNGWTWTASGSTVTVSTKQSNSNLTLRATGTNACGTVFKNYSFTSGPCNVARMVSPSFTIQPNPTRGTFTVSNNLDKNVVIKEVVVRNKIGIIVKEIKLTVKTKELNIDIQELSPDFYFVQIFDGTKWQSIKIIKE